MPVPVQILHRLPTNFKNEKTGSTFLLPLGGSSGRQLSLHWFHSISSFLWRRHTAPAEKHWSSRYFPFWLYGNKPGLWVVCKQQKKPREHNMLHEPDRLSKCKVARARCQRFCRQVRLIRVVRKAMGFFSQAKTLGENSCSVWKGIVEKKRRRK